jgi:hypothetical protein
LLDIVTAAELAIDRAVLEHWAYLFHFFLFEYLFTLVRPSTKDSMTILSSDKVHLFTKWWDMTKVWQYRLWSFQVRDKKIEWFLSKNQL